METNSWRSDFFLYTLLGAYLLAISGFNLGYGFDAVYVRVSFVCFVAATIFVKQRLILTAQLKWLVVFWTFYFVSAFWAFNTTDVLYYVNDFVQILGMSICLPLLVKNSTSLDRIINIVIASIVLTCVRLVLTTPVSAWGSERVGESIGQQANSLGLRLAVAALMCLYMIHQRSEMRKQRKLKVVLYALIMSVFTVISLFTGSKKSLLVIVLGVVMYELLSSKVSNVVPKILGIGLIIGFLGYIIFHNEKLYTVLGRRIEKTFLTLQGDATGYSIDQSLEERDFYKQQAMSLFRQYPFFGFGGNNFVSLMRRINYSHVAYSHNNYTELLATLGFFGFTIYYSFWVKILVGLTKLYTIVKDTVKPQVLLFLILISVNLITDYGNVSYQGEFTQLTLILAALCLSITIQTKE